MHPGVVRKGFPNGAGTAEKALRYKAEVRPVPPRDDLTHAAGLPGSVGPAATSCAGRVVPVGGMSLRPPSGVDNFLSARASTLAGVGLRR